MLKLYFLSEVDHHIIISLSQTLYVKQCLYGHDLLFPSKCFNIILQAVCIKQF